MTIKQKIIDRINTIQNPSTLEKIFNFIKAESEFDEIYCFNEEEKKSINAGLEDVAAGRVYSSQASKEIISKWLSEQSNRH